jgi:ABC-type multidrug transport system ATPase subunit
MSEPAPTLEVKSVSVTRAGRRVLEDVSLTVNPGEILAVVGPNGAGKTTLLEAILGAVPAAGGASIQGKPFRGIGDRARWLAYLAAEAEPPAEVRVGILLDEAGERRDANWTRSLEARLGLLGLRAAAVGALSRGERRRVLLFEALASGKPFLLLDEPTGVFDPMQLLDVIELLRETAERKTGLLVTVHQMSDAEALASRILVLNAGRAIATGTMVELRALVAVSPTAPLTEVFLALLRADRSRQERAPHET